MADLLKLLEQQERCRNRLYDAEMVNLYLAIQKEVNTMAETSTLDISGMFDEIAA